LRRFGISASRRRALVGSLPALERRRIAYPKAQDYADFKVGLQQGFATSEIGLNDQFALQKSRNAHVAFGVISGHCTVSGRCPLYPQKRTLKFSR
jgi:hypothetical protein